VPITADNLPDNLAALKRIIATMAQDALSAQAEIARLKFQLARYRRAEFGRSSEKLAREAEQLELALEALFRRSCAGFQIEPAQSDATVRAPDLN
jgi:transposase